MDRKLAPGRRCPALRWASLCRGHSPNTGGNRIMFNVYYYVNPLGVQISVIYKVQLRISIWYVITCPACDSYVLWLMRLIIARAGRDGGVAKVLVSVNLCCCRTLQIR